MGRRHENFFADDLLVFYLDNRKILAVAEVQRKFSCRHWYREFHKRFSLSDGYWLLIV
jgi:hypothetical protein